MLNILRQRRSVRDFTGQPLTAEMIEALREAVLRVPSSMNKQPWKFIFIEQKDLIEKLATSKAHGTRFMASAQLALVITADPEVSDVWIEDCAIAAITAQYTAESLGLKSCWGQLRLRAHDDKTSASDYVRQLLEIPKGFEVPIIIGFGFPLEKTQGHLSEDLSWEKLNKDHF